MFIDIDIISEYEIISYNQNDMSEINNLLEAAIKETTRLNNGELFLLRDLFKGYEWNRISKRTRLLLGTLFLNKITSEDLGIVPKSKSSSGQQKYQIVRSYPDA